MYLLHTLLITIHVRVQYKFIIHVPFLFQLSFPTNEIHLIFQSFIATRSRLSIYVPSNFIFSSFSSFFSLLPFFLFFFFNNRQKSLTEQGWRIFLVYFVFVHGTKRQDSSNFVVVSPHSNSIWVCAWQRLVPIEFCPSLESNYVPARSQFFPIVHLFIGEKCQGKFQPRDRPVGEKRPLYFLVRGDQRNQFPSLHCFFSYVKISKCQMLLVKLSLMYNIIENNIHFNKF